jgi:aminotransferase
MSFARKRLAGRGVELIDLGSLVSEFHDVIPFMHSFDKPTMAETGKPADQELISGLKARIAEKHLPLGSAITNSEKEVVLTPGIRTAATFLALSLLNPGDVAAYPDPGMQYFRSAICLADGMPSGYPLSERNDYVPNISALTQPPPKKLKILYLNHPHNPTGATVDGYFYRDLLGSIKFENILVVLDCAYIHPGDPDAATILQVKGSRKKVLELHSFATAFGLNGLGFAVGHRDVVSILEGLLDATGFTPDAHRVTTAMKCLDQAGEIFAAKTESLKKRREILSSGLKEIGWRLREARSVPFVWVKPPAWSSSLAFARRLFSKAGVRVAPGSDFGEGGEGWLRMTLHPDERILREALDRISHHSRIWQRKYRAKT